MLRAWFQDLVRRWCGDPGSGIGLRGERAAADHLRRENGYTILRRNWRHGRDEIDLVARDGEVLVFVEVKTRAAHARVGGYEAVDRRKKRALLRASRAYIAELRDKPRTFRFDIVEVEHRDGVLGAVRHFANVPLFPKGFCPERRGN